MDKNKFLNLLRSKLKRFSRADVEEAVSYYDELICEKMQNEYLSEKAAVASLGNVQELANSMAVDMVAQSKVSGINGAMVLIGALSTPIWLPVLLAILIVYVVIFIVFISLTVGFAIASVSSLVASISVLFAPGELATKLFMSGIALVVFAVFGMLCYIVGNYGLKLINIITIKFAKKIIKRGQNI